MTSSYNPITGTSSADTLFGSTSADSIDALGGDDIVYNGGSESDIVALGSGNDSINFSADADGAKVYGQGGNDSLGFTASLNTSTVSGGTANDSLWISKGTAYKAYGDLGNDTITINADFLVLLSSAATSVMPPLAMVLTASPFQRFCLCCLHATGNGGNDTIYIAGKILGGSSVFGGQGNDSIDALTTVSGSYLTGNLGNDTIDVG